MVESFVGLRCPACGEDWQENPTDLPAPRREFTCPHCHESRRLSEFLRTERDLETVKRFQG